MERCFQSEARDILEKGDLRSPQAVHPIGEIGLRVLQCQMVVVGHDDISMNPPAILDDRFPERAFKGVLSTIGGKHGTFPILVF